MPALPEPVRPQIQALEGAVTRALAPASRSFRASLALLENLVTDDPRVLLAAAGSPGVVDLGEGLAAAFGLGGGPFQDLALGARPLSTPFGLSQATLGLLSSGRFSSPPPKGGEVLYVGGMTGPDANAAGHHLVEACQELSHTDWVLDVQSLGSGLAAAGVALVRRTGTGLTIRLEQVSQGGKAWTLHDHLLGERTGGLLLVVRLGAADKALAILRSFGLEGRGVGVVTEDGHFTGTWQGEIVFQVPLPALEDAEPGDLPPIQAAPPEAWVEVALPEDLRPAEVERTLRRLRQVLAQASAAELVTLPEHPSLALAVGCGAGTFLPLDPFWGAAHALVSACRELACVGAEPLGLAVRFPGAQPEPGWSFEQAWLGLRQASVGLEVAVLSATVDPPAAVEASGGGPTPEVAALGLVEDFAGPVALDAPDATALAKVGNRTCGTGFRAPFDGLFLLGETRDELGGSEYLKLRTGCTTGACPDLRLDEELRLQACVREGVRLGLIRSARATGAGGLLGAALGSAFGGAMGCQLLLTRSGLRLDSLLFGETAGRILVSVSPEGEGSLATLCATHRVPLAKIGTVGGSRLTVAIDGQPLLEVGLEDLR
jgi:phosphoribosylformylglycinamidine synthase